MSISAAARSASCMCGSAREHTLPARGRGGCRCWMLDLVLRWFLADVRPKFPDSPALFADESGGALASWDYPQPAAVSDAVGGPPDGRPVQPARAAAGVRDPQL